MKKLISTIVMVFFTTLSFGQVSNETDKKLIKNLVMESFDEIWSKLNSKNIDKYYTKDFLLLENGEVWNNDTIANYLDKALLDKPNPTRINTIEILTLKSETKQLGLPTITMQHFPLIIKSFLKRIG